MNPAKVRRDRLLALTDLPNIGPAMARDLRLLGFEHPGQLAGQDPQTLYDRLCELTGVRQDPCVLDVLVSVTRFMDGEEPKPWWHFTPERK
ncbi:MAG: helix-hairpin-helix domain-containing protein [Desulfomicrobium sp.]